MNAFHNLDAIFCVNLDRRPDRWQVCLNQFKHFGMDEKVMRYPAVENKENPAKGNHTSHANILEIAKLENYKNILILEDDFEFLETPETTQQVLEHALKELPNSWHMLYLGINMDQYRGNQETEHLARINGGFSTHAYIINNSLFEILIKINRDPKTIHNDVSYAQLVHPNYNCFVTVPMLAGQQHGYSDIEGRIVDYNQMLQQRYYNRINLWKK